MALPLAAIGAASTAVGLGAKIFGGRPSYRTNQSDYYDPNAFGQSMSMLDMYDKAEEERMLRRLGTLNRNTVDSMLSFGKAQGLSRGFSNAAATARAENARRESYDTALSMPSTYAGARAGIISGDYSAKQNAKIMASQAYNQQEGDRSQVWNSIGEDFMGVGGGLLGKAISGELNPVGGENTGLVNSVKNTLSDIKSVAGTAKDIVGAVAPISQSYSGPQSFSPSGLANAHFPTSMGDMDYVTNNILASPNPLKSSMSTGRDWYNANDGNKYTANPRANEFALATGHMPTQVNIHGPMPSPMQWANRPRATKPWSPPGGQTYFPNVSSTRPKTFQSKDGKNPWYGSIG